MNLTLYRLLNSLVAAAAASPNNGGGSLLLGGGVGSGGGTSAEGGGGGAAGGGGGQELSHFTAFVVQHVLAHLWQRAYKWVWGVWGSVPLFNFGNYFCLPRSTNTSVKVWIE